MIPVAFALPPRFESLDLLAELIEDEAEAYEVTPETLWWGEAGLPNAYWRLFQSLARRFERPVSAHCVGLSLGSTQTAARRERWESRLARDHEAFGFSWLTDHLGATNLAGLELTLPTPLPMLPEVADRVRRRLSRLRRGFSWVGLESTCDYAVFGHPMDVPVFLGQALDTPGGVLLLDLHNVATMAENMGFDALDWVARAPLHRVVSIHLSGGTLSDPRWLRSGRVLRLDSHDDAVPEAVWALVEAVAPRSPNLRALTLERLEDTVAPHEVAGLRDELRRLRDIGRHLPDPPSATPPPAAEDTQIDEAPMPWESAFAACWRAEDPALAFAELAESDTLDPPTRRCVAAADPDGLRLSGLLIRKLRFSRLLHGSRAALAAFEADEAGFVAEFNTYNQAVPPTAEEPLAEARLWSAWRERWG